MTIAVLGTKPFVDPGGFVANTRWRNRHTNCLHRLCFPMPGAAAVVPVPAAALLLAVMLAGPLLIRAVPATGRAAGAALLPLAGAPPLAVLVLRAALP
jgi:hypothetical protein